MKKLIVIADWADDRLARQEYRSATEGNLKDPSFPNITYVSSTPSTIHTGFITAQIVEVEEALGRPHDTIIFQNTDPRLQTETHVERSQGAEFAVLRLKSGILLCGPNAGYDFSFIRHKIERAYIYRGMNAGSQFRSRDLYSRVCAHLMDNMQDELELEDVGPAAIPQLTGYYVGHIDSYGNIKTTIRQSDLKGKFELGDDIHIRLNGIDKKAKYVSNLFGGEIGELVIYPGSSGPKDDLFLEVSIWRHFDDHVFGTGQHEFNNPRPGMQIEITG